MRTLVFILLSTIAMAQDYPPQARAVLITTNASSSLTDGRAYAVAYQAGLLNYYATSAFGLTTTGVIASYYAAKYYLLGSTLAQMKYNFINTSSYTLTDVNTCTYSAAGIGTSASGNKYVNTNFNDSTNGSDTMGIQIYSSAISTTGDNNMMGVDGTILATSSFTYLQMNGSTIYTGMHDNGNFSFANGSTTYNGISHFIQRQGAPNYTKTVYFQSGALKKTNTATALFRPNYSIFVGGVSDRGTINKPMTATIGCFGITSGRELTTAQVLESWNIDSKILTTGGKN